MKSIAGIVAIVAGLFPGGPTQSAEISDIRRLLTHAPLICGGFTQSKSLKALTRPLVSSGRVVFAAGNGVLWQVTAPFPARALIRADALIRWDEDGQPKRTGFGQSPRFRALSDVFLAVFAGDTDRLAETFEVSVSVGPTAWRFDLKPRDEAFARQISGISVSGAQFVEELRFAEGRGDRTTILFRALTSEGCVLSDAERRDLAR